MNGIERALNGLVGQARVQLLQSTHEYVSLRVPRSDWTIAVVAAGTFDKDDIRSALTAALIEALGSVGDDGFVQVDPSDPEDIKPLVDAIVKVITGSAL